MSAAFLETTANEFFADCADGVPRVSVLDPQRVALAARLWANHVPRTASFPILDKFQIALATFSLDAFDRGAEPYQSAALVVSLRNELLHAEPAESVTQSSIPDVPVDVHRFERQLDGRFTLNPLMGPGNAFFPDRLLSAGCARWAQRSTLAFSDAFFGRLGLPAPYEHVRAELAG